MTDTENKVVEITDDNVPSDDDMPALEEATANTTIEEGDESEEAAAEVGRSEKKMRKALMKLGLKPVPGIQRVAMKKQPNVLFAVKKPDVYVVGDTYVVFGEYNVEDMNAQARAQAQMMQQQQAAAGGDGADDDDDDIPALEEAPVDEGDVDETGVEAEDIELVVQQANVSRGQAVKALKENDNDVVNAIMTLTT
ncbi:hypothetical protein SARC_00688 [Sphaeroforma arctica JP610]|uniref:NAC-A/B domain-containing protein n=1 Tax=Sphaeroforma arctica JP610 TaxID=667725 RepID=A0A0L0GDT4_9EUKA|nr:hypothetical protein SARC_00688 [Sphaeroforma arctica JP610]KNC87160.1 hypothetical protein SARC_00688 [Sphaeroforma arctica JP610]|eukprot:XP_014161062.1 hypothetical protein SARC_00688 [Sphaeroforma arctica JP610]